MKIRVLVTVLLPLLLLAFKGDKPAYVIYTKGGSASEYASMMKAVKEADVVFFGEQHDNPMSHWLQLQVTKDLFAKKKDKLLLGAEMFEADNQLILNEYLSDAISENSFESECRIWPNYETDYKPLVLFAKENDLRFIATNIPRRYASIVYKGGFESLETIDATAKTYIAPLPPPYDASVGCYQEMLEMAAGHGGDNLPKAQAIKDATMAHFIMQNLADGQTLLHYNGAYHSDNYEGIIWYLNQYKPGLKIVTITSVTQENIDKLEDEHRTKADFIVCIPEDMTRTH